MGHRGLQQNDLTHRPHGLEELRRLGVAHSDPHHIAALRQALDDITPDEPRSAENRRNTDRRHTHHAPHSVRGGLFSPSRVVCHGKSCDKSPMPVDDRPGGGYIAAPTDAVRRECS